jgi:uncharacterized membrane protein YbhN (UPF0104 family)
MRIEKRNKIVNFSIKLFLFSLFIVLLYWQIFVKNDPAILANEFFNSIRLEKLYLFVLAVFLAFANWSLEAAKWKLLMSPYFIFSFMHSLKIIFMGIAGGIITPLQFGEYFGRIVSVNPSQNWKSFWATFIGSIAQNISTLFFGIFGLFFLLKSHYNVENHILYPSFYLGLAGVIVLILIYFNIGYALKIASGLGFSKWVERITDKKAHPEHKWRLLNKVLMLSYLRYIVFATQFYLLLIFFGLENNVISLFSGISAIFLLQTGIPLPPVVNFLARGELAILVFEQITTNEIMILSSTFSLWIINLVFPSIIGMSLLIRMNIVKKLGYDG